MTFTWKDRSSAEFGIVVNELPPLITPERRDKTVTVPDRSGALHMQDGAWEEIIRNVEIYLPYEQGKTMAAMSAIQEWLTGYSWVAFSNVPNRKFRAYIVSAIQFKDWVNGYEDKMATV